MSDLRSHRSVKAKLLFGHFIVAMALNTTQPLYPVLKAALGLSVLETSVLPTVLTLASTFANLLAGVLIARVGQRNLLIAAYILMAAGNVALFAAPGFAALAAAFGIIGVGVGWAFTSMTTMYSGLPVEMQNFGLYHALFGLGGIVGPLILTQVLRIGMGYQPLFLAFAVVLVLMLGAFLLDRGVENIRFREFRFSHMFGVLRRPFVLLALLAFGSYAAVEIGTSNLSGIMHVESYGRSEIFAGNALVLFWLAFAVSRFFSDGLAKRFGSVRLAAFAGAIAFVSILLWTLGLSPWLFIAAGLAFGPIFPVLQKYANHQLESGQRGLLNGMTYAFTGLGAALTMPLMGRLGDIRMAYSFIPSLILLLFFLGVLALVPRWASKT
jgi:fucose permease